MPLIFDAHVHLYPCYNLATALRLLSKNLVRLGGTDQKAAFLAERHDCHFFKDLKQHEPLRRHLRRESGISIRETAEENGIQILIGGDTSFYLFAGRQIVTSERIEILALTVDAAIPDGLRAVEAVERILDVSGIPVLSWAPGKWMFRRKPVVQNLIDGFRPGEIILGDTSLRPLLWPEPLLFAYARKRGFNIIAGSDPLPLQGEEVYLGTYATAVDGLIDDNQPVTAMRGLLKKPGSPDTPRGCRNHTLEAVRRIIGNANQKKRPAQKQTDIRAERETFPIMEDSIYKNHYCKIPPGTRVLVTGATGFTGTVLTRKLAAAGLKINAIARPTSNLKPLADLEINWFYGDVFDKSVLAEASHDVKYVFHLAAAFREAKSSEEDYRNVHVESTKLLAKRATSNTDFKRFVHISTIGVHGHIEDPKADETYRFSPGDGYQRTKLQAELWLQDFAETAALPYTIIRPAAIYGPGDKRLLKLFKMARWKYFPLLGKGKCYYHLIHVEDLANSIIIAATEPRALGEVFISGNDKPIPIAEIARLVAATLGGRTRVIRLPIKPFFWAADICEAICLPLRIEPPIYRRRVAFYSKDRMFDTRKLRNVLGYTPLHSNEAGITETAQWYLSKGWLKPLA